MKRLEIVIFGDFELLGRFAEKCETDIEKLKCGRNEAYGNSPNQRVLIFIKTLRSMNIKI